MRYVFTALAWVAGILIVLLAAVAMAMAQTTTSNSGSASLSNAGSTATNTLHNSGNQSATAIGGGSATSRSGARSNSTSGSTSNAQSGTSRVRTSSTQAVQVNIGRGNGSSGDPSGGATDPSAPTDPASQLGSPGLPLTETINGTQTLRNTPEIVAPNISGGNPCLVGISGGGAGPGIGITFGVGYSDRGCERRNEAALLSNIGERDVAVELMCDDGNVRAAMARTGHPCAADRATAQPVASSVDPAVIRREQAAGVQPIPPVAQLATVASPPAKPPRPDWCYTASKQELRSHPQCD